MLSSQDILKKYFALYQSNGHIQISNMSLVPEGDSTLLFVNCGMFPLGPYLSGEQHPLGKRLMNVQRAGRFQEDLEEVGDNRHTTMFHMIGNWSLGDYFKKEQLGWIYGFLIDELGLDPQRIFATVFEGDRYAPRDIESIEIIKDIFAKYKISAKENKRIYTCGRDKNWWQRGEVVGELGGPDSEIYYYLGTGSGEGKDPSKHEEEFLEIGNTVFMQYRRIEGNGWAQLPQNNVDFGGGLERIALVCQGKQDIFETDMFWPIIEKIQSLSGKDYYENEKTKRAMRTLADHIRSITIMAMDGVVPSNKDQGYFLRRILRRMVRTGRVLGIEKGISVNLVDTVCTLFSWLYPELSTKQSEIKTLFADEEQKFSMTLINGQRELQRIIQHHGTKLENPNVAAQYIFDLYQSIGFPPEMSLEELVEHNIHITDKKKHLTAYEQYKKKHQDLSRKGAEQKFKGGLADHSTEVVQLHTATHVLHQSMRTVLGPHIQQQGSNITNERLRFDFSHDFPLADHEIKKIEALANETIQKKLPVQFVILPKEEAEKTGALHFFKEKYGEKVKVYFIGNDIKTAFSKEFCGGPHVSNLSELSPTLSIYKQESVGKGVRRIYARFG